VVRGFRRPAQAAGGHSAAVNVHGQSNHAVNFCYTLLLHYGSQAVGGWVVREALGVVQLGRVRRAVGVPLDARPREHRHDRACGRYRNGRFVGWMLVGWKVGFGRFFIERFRGT
jgi:hypothetical protein